MAVRSGEEWRALFEAQARSGMTAAAFCRERGLCPKYFSLRRKQLGSAAPGSVASPFVRIEPVVAPSFEAPAPCARLRLGRCEWELSGLPVGELVRLMVALA